MKLSNLRKKAKKALLPRCGAIYGSHICQRELGHDNGWRGAKHRQDGVTWTDAGAQREAEEKAASQNETTPS